MSTISQYNRQLIAAKLKAARMQAGLSQDAVAQKLHMHRTGWVKRESGQIPINVDELPRICKALQISPGGILGPD